MKLRDRTKHVLRRYLLENLGLKILSLFIGFALWFFISLELQIEKSVDVPVDIVNKPANLEIANEYSRNVVVKLQMPQFQNNVVPNSMAATIDLSKAEAGEKLFPLNETNFKFPPGFKILSVQPPAVSLVLEPVATKLVPVKVRYNGLPAENFRVTAIQANPSTVMITGASSHIKRAQEVPTQTIDISGRTTSLNREINLVPESKFIHVFSQDQVSVSLQIQERCLEKVFHQLPVKVEYLDLPYRLFPYSPVTVSTRVPISALSKIQPEDLEIYIDGRDCQPGLAVQEIQLKCRVVNILFQEGLVVDRIEPQTVRIRLLK